MKQLESLPEYKEVFEKVAAYESHVVRYSGHERSGTWCDICIEQKLMKAAKSEGRLSRGRMSNSYSGHKCWVQALNHFAYVNQRMDEGMKKHRPLHKDLRGTRMKRDAEAIARGFRRMIPLTKIEIGSSLCNSQLDSQALQCRKSS